MVFFHPGSREKYHLLARKLGKSVKCSLENVHEPCNMSDKSCHTVSTKLFLAPHHSTCS